MKDWIQLCAALLICCQLVACGGGESKSAATGAPENNSVAILPIASEAKVLTDSFTEARTLWATTAPANYHYNYKEGGVGHKFEAYSPVTIWVRAGEISQVTSGVQVLKIEDYQHASIEHIFTRMAYTMSHSQTDTRFHVEYDPLLGFPTQFKVTPNCCAQGTQLIVTDLQVDQ